MSVKSTWIKKVCLALAATALAGTPSNARAVVEPRGKSADGAKDQPNKSTMKSHGRTTQNAPF